MRENRCNSARRIDEWIRKGQGEDGETFFASETCPHQVLFMGIMNAIPISSKGPKEDNALVLQDGERNAAYFGKFKVRYFMYIVPGSEKTWHFEKYPHNPEGKWNELAKQVTNVYLVQNYPILTGCIYFRNRDLKRGGENMHFSGSDPSFKMIVDLISSANDFCIDFIVCDHLGKIYEIDVESPQNTASVVLTPRVSETVTLSRI